VAKQRHKSAFDAALADQLVHLAQHFRQAEVFCGARLRMIADWTRRRKVRRPFPSPLTFAERVAKLLRTVPQEIIKTHNCITSGRGTVQT